MPVEDRFVISIMNEQIKLRANAYNIASVSCFTVGILTPFASFFYGPPQDINHKILTFVGFIGYTLLGNHIRSLANGFLLGLRE